MTRSPILFRVDATRTSGFESFWRCLTFSAALQRRRRPTYFLSKLEPKSLAFAVKRIGNNWLGTNTSIGSEQDLDELISEVRRLQPGAVVLDGQYVSESYVEAVQNEGPMVLLMDHIADRRFPSRLVVNPLLSPGREQYDVVPGAQILLGSRYSLVRPEIRRLRPLRAQEPVPPFRAMIALGDDDPHEQSLDLAKLMLTTPGVERVDIIARPHHPQLEQMQELAQANEDKLEIATEPSEVAARVIRCHFAVTSGDTWSLELACVGIPQLVIVQDESHWPTAQQLEEEGAATCLGWHETLSAKTIREAAVEILDDPFERKSMSRCGRRLIDGRGADRLVNGLEIMLNRRRPVELEADLAA